MSNLGSLWSMSVFFVFFGKKSMILFLFLCSKKEYMKRKMMALIKSFFIVYFNKPGKREKRLKIISTHDSL